MNKYNAVIPEPPTESSTTNRAYYRRQLRAYRRSERHRWQQHGIIRAEARFLARMDMPPPSN